MLLTDYTSRSDAQRHFASARLWDLFDGDRIGRFGKGSVCAGIEEQELGAGRAAQDRFYAMLVQPPRPFEGIRAGEGRNVGVDYTSEAMGYARSHASKSRTRGREHEGRLRGAAQSFACDGVGRITRLRKDFTGDGEQAGSGRGENRRGCVRVRGNDANGERRGEARGEFFAGRDGFE